MAKAKTTETEATEATDAGTITTDTELDTATLRGDIRDVILREFKCVREGWSKLSEDEQDRLIGRAADIADTLVRRSVDLVAAKGLPSLPIEVGKFTVDGAGVKGAFECYADDDSLLRIRHLAGHRAMFVLASPDAFNAERQPATADNVGDLAMPKATAADAMIAAMEADGHTRGDADELRPRADD